MATSFSPDSGVGDLSPHSTASELTCASSTKKEKEFMQTDVSEESEGPACKRTRLEQQETETSIYTFISPTETSSAGNFPVPEPVDQLPDIGIDLADETNTFENVDLHDLKDELVPNFIGQGYLEFRSEPEFACEWPPTNVNEEAASPENASQTDEDKKREERITQLEQWLLDHTPYIHDIDKLSDAGSSDSVSSHKKRKKQTALRTDEFDDFLEKRLPGGDASLTSDYSWLKQCNTERVLPPLNVQNELADFEEPSHQNDLAVDVSVDFPELSPSGLANYLLTKDVVEISSSDEDVVMLDSDREEEEEEEEEPEEEEEEEEAEDPNNSGSHVNDAMNLPDAEGRVLVNVGHPPDEPDIFLAPQLSRAVKPHQIGGIRFLYDNLVESLARYKQSQGFGCILAHSMGLGKTLQVIAFTDIFLRHTGARTVMIIVPVNTLANWVAEFNMWLPSPDDPRAKDKTAEEFLPRDMNVNIVTDNMKTVAARAKVVEKWHKEGGVLLLGYEMYRLLTSKRTLNLRPKKSKKKKNPNDEPEVIDLEEEDRNKELMNVMHDALTKPGPDLVICDEGHRIKNSHASISRALKSIRTKRRVVLTGYPLQNNLLEYWCMVDFVRPNFLGNKTEFCNMFERPIMNGQCMDSTPQDVRLMRFRAHVLHSLLEGFVQRRGHTVLRQALPEKNEYVLLVRMSPIQKALYARFMEVLQDPNFDAWENNNPIKAFSVCCKMWNHPDILHQIVATKKIKEDNDLDIDYKTTETDTKKKKVPTATLR